MRPEAQLSRGKIWLSEAACIKNTDISQFIFLNFKLISLAFSFEKRLLSFTIFENARCQSHYLSCKSVFASFCC